MKTSTRVAVPFFYALVEAYQNENYSEEHPEMEPNHSEYSHDTNQDQEILSISQQRITDFNQSI